ncbi:asparaginase [Sphingomonas sp. MMS24-J13]|uniref:asparaginase n=1 Tax=Sphingomonas sp. MMS24-J13 TaxID=3238686 RepID=UPI00385128D4
MRKPATLFTLLRRLAPSGGARTRADAALKTVRLLATGGTIAGAGEGSSVSYRAGVVPIGAILRAVPGLDAVAKVSAEQVANVGSEDVDQSIWLTLLGRIRVALADPEVAGIVITHGTDTLEETAYFLSLVLPSAKPVVVVGSMRPGTATSADGPENLLDALRVASADEACDRGTMVVMNDTIFDPEMVTKVDVRRVNAFAAPSRGPIGDVLTGRPRFFADATPHDAAFPVVGPAWPRVAIAYAYAGFQGDDVRAAANGAEALVIAGVGAGSFSAGARQAVKALTARGIPVVRTGRQGMGDVWFNPPSMGDMSDAALGTIAGRELPPAKARILLLLALQTPRSREELQSLFDRYGAGGR